MSPEKTNHTLEQRKMKRNVEYEQRDGATLETTGVPQRQEHALFTLVSAPGAPRTLHSTLAASGATSSIGFTDINRYH